MHLVIHKDVLKILPLPVVRKMKYLFNNQELHQKFVPQDYVVYHVYAPYHKRISEELNLLEIPFLSCFTKANVICGYRQRNSSLDIKFSEPKEFPSDWLLKADEPDYTTLELLHGDTL